MKKSFLLSQVTNKENREEKANDAAGDNLAFCVANAFFDVRELARIEVKLLRYEIDGSALITEVIPETERIINNEKRNPYSYRKCARVNAFIVANRSGKRSSKGSVRTWHVTMGGEVFPLPTMLPAKDKKLDELRQETHDNRNQKNGMLAEKTMHLFPVVYTLFFSSEFAILKRHNSLGKYMISIVLLVILVVLGLWFVLLYNGFVRLKTRTDEAWSDIDVQLKRRYDLIPNLVNAVKGYASHERELFEKVTAARAQAMQAGNASDRAQAENTLSATLKSLFAVAEAYPDLKANQNFLQLQSELSDTENKIQASRRFYNGNVMELNAKVDSFPSNIIANMFHFTKRDFFQAGEGEKEPVKVEF